MENKDYLIRSLAYFIEDSIPLTRILQLAYLGECPEDICNVKRQFDLAISRQKEMLPKKDRQVYESIANHIKDRIEEQTNETMEAYRKKREQAKSS